MARNPLVMHVITGLDVGGAEIMLANLVAAMDRSSFDVEVVSLLAEGAIAERIRDSGIKVHTLQARKGSFNVGIFLRLWKIVRKRKPQVIHAWMYHANVLDRAVRLFNRRVPLIWAIHVSQLDGPGIPFLTRILLKLSPWLSRYVEAIVYVSALSRDLHVSLGFDNTCSSVIANGFDIEAFRPNPTARDELRHDLGLDRETKLVGLIARYHPQKDHAAFVTAAALLGRRMPDVHFVLCGLDVDASNPNLAEIIGQAGIADRCHLLGIRDDIARINAGLDLATTSSAFGEAFPLVIGEAMACGIPCVVTDVGDSGDLVGDTGVIVPPRDPEALSNAWHTILSMPDAKRRALGDAARRRIHDNYSLDAICGQYQALYRQVLEVARP